jgi:hypothetical protein
VSLLVSGAATETEMRAAKDIAATVIRHNCEKNVRNTTSALRKDQYFTKSCSKSEADIQIKSHLIEADT